MKGKRSTFVRVSNGANENNLYQMSKMKLPTEVQALPKGMQDVYLTTNKCILHLVKAGSTLEQAEGAVLEILKENAYYLEKGMYKQTQAALEMIFMDKPVSSFKLEQLIDINV